MNATPNDGSVSKSRPKGKYTDGTTAMRLPLNRSPTPTLSSPYVSQPVTLSPKRLSDILSPFRTMARPAVGTTLNDAGSPVSLYAGYYNSQRQGDTIHSPQNCLPGAGWRPISAATIALPVRSGPASVNQYVIQKGLDTQVVLYWYQGRGRVVANEYRNKLLMMWDAATKHRTNGGLVRVISPVRPGSDAAGDAVAFATALLPRLERLMP